MSFQFNWPRFSDEIRAMLAQQIEEAINQATLPNTSIGKIGVLSFDPGSQVENMTSPCNSPC